MKTITRRTALAVPVTLPLLPVSAFAAPADPAVEAYRVAGQGYHASVISSWGLCAARPRRGHVQIANLLSDRSGSPRRR